MAKEKESVTKRGLNKMLGKTKDEKIDKILGKQAYEEEDEETDEPEGDEDDLEE